MACCSRLVNFFFKEKFCVEACVGKSLARWLSFEAFWRPCQKNYISSYIWHKSFIQTVKCSFFSQIIVYQSFTGASFMFSYFFFEEKFCVLPCVGKSLARMFIVWSVPKTLSRKLYLQLYLTQTVPNGKIHFPQRKSCLLKFLSCAAHILLFLIFFKEKFCVSSHVSKSRACLDRVYFVSKKNYHSVVFAPWGWDCWSV